MRYFIDTEFIESGPGMPIELLSIGIVAEDGREFYAESNEYITGHVTRWLQDNVMPHLGKVPKQSLEEIGRGILEFVGEDERPEFWAYHADYDWVVFCQIFGRMIDLPDGFPKFCRDIKQLASDLGNPQLPKQESDEHHALADARWNKRAHEFLVKTKEDMGLTALNAARGLTLSEYNRIIESHWKGGALDDR